MAEYDQATLMTLFPGLDWESPTVVRCVRRTEGEGKLVQAVGDRSQYGHVRVRCDPAFALSITLAHQWPDGLAPEEALVLDEALLQGLVEGLGSGEYPAWLCSVTSLHVTHVANHTTEQPVRVAARLAAEDALRHPDWKLVTRPRGSAPHGEEPA